MCKTNVKMDFRIHRQPHIPDAGYLTSFPFILCSNTYGIHFRYRGASISLLTRVEMLDSGRASSQKSSFHIRHSVHKYRALQTLTHTRHTYFICTYFMERKLKCNRKGIRRWKIKEKKERQGGTKQAFVTISERSEWK